MLYLFTNKRTKLILNFILLLIIFDPIFLHSQTKIPPEKPKLVVFIVFDQMRYDMLGRYWDKFEEKGFKRLFDEGTICKNTHHNQLYNSSLTGYANLVTGTYSSVHGIIADEWYNGLEKKTIQTLEDTKAGAINGNKTQSLFSTKNLAVSTLADEIKLASNGKSKVFAMSMRNVNSVILAGHMADGAYWLNTETGEWMSSAKYPEAKRKWMDEWHAKKHQDEYLNRTWTPLKDLNTYEESDFDDSSYEIGLGKRQNKFPYILQEIKSEAKYDILRYTPMGNTYLKDLALATMVYEEMGKDNVTDFIGIGFSAGGLLGDLYGPRAVEIEDLYLRLDKDLGHLLEFLDNFVGQENVLVVATSDQGAPDVPAYLEKRGMPYGYFNAKKAETLLQSYLKALYGRGDWISSYQNMQFYLNQGLIDNSKINLDEIQLKSAQFLAQFTGVALAMPTGTFRKSYFNDGFFLKFQNSFNQKKSGDIMLLLEPGWIESGTKKYPTVYTHFSGYQYNTHVPLLWYGWKTKRIEISRMIETIDIAPTISTILQIPKPNSTTGKTIDDLF